MILLPMTYLEYLHMFMCVYLLVDLSHNVDIWTVQLLLYCIRLY